MSHRSIRRIAALLLCLALLLAMAPQALAYDGVSSWAQEEVMAADKLGIIPEALSAASLSGPMKRVDMCHMAVNAFMTITGAKLYPAKITHFIDTNDDDVCIAFELGLVSGYPDHTFLPEKQITRQEFSKIMENLLHLLGWSEDKQVLSGFSDDTLLASWAVPAAAKTVSLGIVTGSSGNTLQPLGSTSIEQACAMFQRTFHLLSIELSSGIVGAADPVGEYQPTYTDVSNWAKETVKEMDLIGLLPASVQTASMKQPITRAQMCDMALVTYCTLTGATPEVPEAKFTDTDAPSISQACELGLVSGFPDGTFRPDECLTRQQFFQITANLLNVCGYTDESDEAQLKRSFTDADAVSDWACAPIALLHRMGILKGNTEGALTPAAQTTCEQAIAMFMRTYSQISDWYSVHPLSSISGPLTVPRGALQAVELAKSFVGYPYVWAGATPSVGFDCSGLVYYVYGQCGYKLNRAGDGMAKNGIAVSEKDLQPGDILIFSNKSTGAIQHVGLYIGDGLMVHAQSSQTGVVISKYDYDYNKFIYTIRRIIY